MKHKKWICAAALIALLPSAAFAASVTAEMKTATDKGPGASMGTVTFTDTDKGLAIKTDLKGLSPGRHGFHVHEFADCAPKIQDGKVGMAMAAGGHLDPAKTGKHMGPNNGGHLGDLPALQVQADGTATLKTVIPGIKTSDIRSHALVIHENPDSYTDTPPMGGSGNRIGCGIIQ